jgi:hypothetical protein
VIHDAVCRQDRDGHEDDHPAGVDQRVGELCAVQLEPVDGRADEQVEVPREKKARQGGDHVREQEDREEPDQDQP